MAQQLALIFAAGGGVGGVVAQAALFLAFAAAACGHGHDLGVDGGLAHMLPRQIPHE